jgi:hypothetical protein
MRRTPFIAALGVLIGLAACSKHPTNTMMTAASSPPVQQSDSDESNDPCALLEPKEVEAVLGGPLGTPPFRGATYNPSEDGSDCVYMSANFQAITLHVDYEGGPQAYHIGDFVGNILKGAGALNDKTKKAMVAEDGSEIAGEWDEAKLTPMNCCIFNALRADQMISIDFTGSAATLKQAAALVDSAFKRIDKPLAIDSSAKVERAKAFLKTRPARRDPCSILSQAEVEAILGKLIAPPAANSDSCSYELPPHGIRQVYQMDFRWHGGNYDFRSDMQAAKVAGVALGSMENKYTTQVQVADAPPAQGTAPGGTGTQPAPTTHTETVTQTVTTDEASRQVTGQTFTENTHLTGEEGKTAGPWERSATVGPKFEAVKKDILLQVDLRGVDPGKAQALAAAVMQKL